MMLIERSPIVGVADNPLAGLRPSDMRVARVGASLTELAPITDKRVICTMTGVVGYVPRAMWDRRVQPGDIVVFEVDPPENRDLLRVALLIAVTYFSAGVGNAAFAAGSFGATATTIGLSLVGAILVNALLPPSLAQPSSGSTQQAFTVALAGNEARLDQPIWKNCGYRKITPPYAGTPYVRYRDVKGTGFDTDQYFYGVFAVGIGNHEIVSKLIANTSISHYRNVIRADYLPPGTMPTDASVTVYTVKEVAQVSLDAGRYVGGFAVCPPGTVCDGFEVDIGAPRGMYSSGGAVQLKWRVEYREISEFNVPLSGWTVAANQSKTHQTTTPQRWTYTYELPTSKRVEVRVVRTSNKSTDQQVADDLSWLALRGLLDVEAPLNPNCAHFEIVMRASEQLNAQTNDNFALVLTGMARPYDPDSGGFGDYEATRNPAWWCLDLLRDSVWGLGLGDDRIDLTSFYEFGLTCLERQDRFDYTFDTTVDAWEALQLIARAGRARCFRRFGVVSIARDELVTLPVTAFTPRNTQPGSMKMKETHPGFDTPDGVILEYTSNISWDIARIECPFPGRASPAMQRPLVVRLDGITGATHAHREGLYEAAVRYYRTRTVSCVTEMQAVLVNYMAAIRWQPDIAGYGQSGDLTYWDEDTRILGLSEPPDWSSGEDLYIRLIRDDGTLTDAVQVTPGTTAFDVTLPAIPDFELVLDDGTRERPQFLLGPLVGADELVKILAIADGGQQDGAQLFEITAVVDDERVHEADLALLPGPGDVQDPVGADAEAAFDDEDGTLSLANLNDHLFEAFGAGTDASASFTLGNTGVASVVSSSFTYPADYFSNEWSLFGTIDPTVAAGFEVRATPTGDYGSAIDVEAVLVNPTGASVNTWLNMGTTRTWTLAVLASDPNVAQIAAFLVEIRAVGSTDVQASATITLHVRTLGTGGDGHDGGNGGE